MDEQTKDFLTNLTEVELETESKAIFTLCETAIDVELYESEKSVLDSFLEWARSENGRLQSRIINLDNEPPKEEIGQASEEISDQNTPTNEEINPMQAIINEIKILINGMSYRETVNPVAVALAKNHGIVILYGHSDDLLELEGAINDEIGAYNGLKSADVVENQMIPSEIRDLFKTHNLDLIWSDDDGKSWSFKVDERSRFERFNILEDGEVFSEGIILSLTPKDV